MLSCTARVVGRERLNAEDYDTLIMDTQGSELLVLQGAGAILQKLKYIKTEVADFEAYNGCCQLKDMNSFLTSQGFREFARNRFGTRAGGGSYYDLYYERFECSKPASASARSE